MSKAYAQLPQAESRYIRIHIDQLALHTYSMLWYLPMSHISHYYGVHKVEKRSRLMVFDSTPAAKP